MFLAHAVVYLDCIRVNHATLEIRLLIVKCQWGGDSGDAAEWLLECPLVLY